MKQRLCICGFPLKKNGIECTRPSGRLFAPKGKEQKRKPPDDAEFDFG